MSAAIVAPFVNDIIAKANFSRSSRSAEYGNFNALPPGLKCFLLDDARHRQGTIRNLARIIDAQNLTPLIGERVPVILIKCSAAIAARCAVGQIDAQFERPVWFIVRGL